MGIETAMFDYYPLSPLLRGGSFAVVIGVASTGGGLIHSPMFESQRSWPLWRAVRLVGGKGVAIVGVSWHSGFGGVAGG